MREEENLNVMGSIIGDGELRSDFDGPVAWTVVDTITR